MNLHCIAIFLNLPKPPEQYIASPSIHISGCHSVTAN